MLFHMLCFFLYVFLVLVQNLPLLMLRLSTLLWRLSLKLLRLTLKLLWLSLELLWLSVDVILVVLESSPTVKGMLVHMILSTLRMLPATPSLLVSVTFSSSAKETKLWSPYLKEKVFVSVSLKNVTEDLLKNKYKFLWHTLVA